MKTQCRILVMALFLATGPVAIAQNSHNFVYLRGGSASPFLLFYTYDFLQPKIAKIGSPMLVISNTIDPHGSEYKEYDLGGAINFNLGNMGAAIPFFLGAKASDSWYAQVGGYFWTAKGNFSASTFLFQYLPLENEGVAQTLIDPANAMCKFSSLATCGISYTLAKIEGLPTEHAIGPSIQIFIPHTGDDSLTMDFFKGIDNYEDEIRLTFQASF